MARKGKPAPEETEARRIVAASEDGGEGPASFDDDEEEIPVWVIDADEGDGDGDGDGAHLDALETAGEGAGEASGGELEQLREELAGVREQWIRALADLDNYRKRADREQREQRRYALFEPMRELLPVVDNLERAVASGGSVDDLKRGVEMVLSQLLEVLRGLGVRPIPAAGAPFDPAIHDAVSRHEDQAVAAPTVSEELQRGYTLHDRLLRPALVKVAMPSAPEPSAAKAAPGGDE